MFDYFDYKDDPRVLNTDNRPPALRTPQMQFAQAYVPFQKFDTIMAPDKALMQGTVFPELDMPYKKKM